MNQIIDLKLVLPKVLAQIIVSDGHTNDMEYVTSRNIYEWLLGEPIDNAYFDECIREAIDHNFDIMAYLESLRWHMPLEVKTTIIKACIAVAFSDCNFHFSESVLIDDIGDSLGLTKEEIDSIKVEGK